jgi:outer membrane biosynthesis protein TonB
MRSFIRATAALAATTMPALALAQFAMVPAAQCKAPQASQQQVEQEYRIEASRHLYGCYPARIFRGKLPPLLYGVMMAEIDLDAQGNVVGVTTVRKPAAAEVDPWVQAMVRRASPFPAPAAFPGGTLRFTETFFVDKSGLFQTFTLTEGQR